MPNIIFPTGFTIDFSHLSMEMMQFYSEKWNLEHKQMGKGLFEGKLRAVHTPRIQLALNHSSTGLLSRGDFPKGSIVLNSYFSCHGIYSFQNKPILPNEIIALTKGDEVDRVSSGQFSGHIVTIEEQLFYKAFYSFFGETPNLSLKMKRFYIKKDMITVFHQTISLWIDYLMNTLPTLDIKPEYEKIESKILSQLFSCISFSSLKKERKKFSVKAVRDILEQNIEQNIDLQTIMQDLSISESQLHNAFKSNYGISPKKYHQMLRLNAVRNELLNTRPKYNTVSEIAMKYNFFNMNKFSAMYKKVFAETPSQTLYN
jgi:AraC-like DNA-binding protein